MAVALGAAALFFRPSPEWVEGAYANGFYPYWEHSIYQITSRLPWSFGDVVVISGVLWLLFHLIRRQWLWALAVLCIYGFWFEASWGWNYNRAPIETRVVYDASKANPRAVDALRKRAIAAINALAPLAHARKDDPLDYDALYDDWLPVVQAAGDRWIPWTYPPCPTLAYPFMNATGTTGYINPLTLNSHLASDLLWFERPFVLAHEWSHVAAYAREDEANYLAAVTTTRSHNVVEAYSGWLELFMYLPPLQKYPKTMFVSEVWEDFAAIRARNKAYVNLNLSTISWGTYNTYLKSNHIANGIENYNEVTRLYLGVALDRTSVPIPK